MIKLTLVKQEGTDYLLVFAFSDGADSGTVQVVKEDVIEQVMAFRKLFGRIPDADEFKEMLCQLVRATRKKEIVGLPHVDWANLLNVDLEA
jgi:phosphoserine aminotransferase